MRGPDIRSNGGWLAFQPSLYKPETKEVEVFQRNSIRLGTKIAVPAALAGLIISSGCSSKTTEMQSHWSADSIKVDGQVEDWSNTPLTYFEDEQVSLGLRNDDENLYILFRTKSQTWERLIRTSGLTMWLDETGGKKKDFGIRYIGGLSLSEMQKTGIVSERGLLDSLMPEQKQRLIRERETMANQIEVLSEEGKQKIIIPADGSRGPAISSAVSQGIYTYELRIPLQDKRGDYYFIKPQPPGQTLGIGLEWGGIDNLKQMMQQRGEGMEGGGRPPGGIGPGSGGPPGGVGPGGSGPGGPSGQRPERQKIWVKILLALPPEE
jgi:hypothetical protein